MNSKLNLECSDKITILRNDDVLAIIKKNAWFERW
jgi:DNA-directed RNA polymerase subunit beta